MGQSRPLFIRSFFKFFSYVIHKVVVQTKTLCQLHARVFSSVVLRGEKMQAYLSTQVFCCCHFRPRGGNFPLAIYSLRQLTKFSFKIVHVTFVLPNRDQSVAFTPM